MPNGSNAGCTDSKCGTSNTPPTSTMTASIGTSLPGSAVASNGQMLAMDFIWVALGGAAGASLRYGLSGWVVDRLGVAFPFHTLLINVSGSLTIGALMVLLTERLV